MFDRDAEDAKLEGAEGIFVIIGSAHESCAHQTAKHIDDSAALRGHVFGFAFSEFGQSAQRLDEQLNPAAQVAQGNNVLRLVGDIVVELPKYGEKLERETL